MTRLLINLIAWLTRDIEPGPDQEDNWYWM